MIQQRTARGSRGWLRIAVLILAAATAVAANVGCDRSSGSAGSGGQAGSIRGASWNQSLFDTSIDQIEHLEEYQVGEMLVQAVQGLNQSLEGSEQEAWQPDPLVFNLPLEYRELPAIKRLGATQFDFAGALELQEAFWLRDASLAARGNRVDDVARASALFDWIVRNIPLEPDSPADGSFDLVHPPRQLLLLGRGDAVERAWLFILMARQQGLDVVMLGLRDTSKEEGYRLWLPALVSSGQLYLFDTQLGLPIPGPDGQPVATLEQVTADDGLLRALDLDGEPYPVRADQTKEVLALIEGSPAYLSRRMRMVELRLTGNRKVVLTIAPSALKDQLQSIKYVKDAGLWDVPYRAMAQQSLPEAQRATAKELAHYQLDVLPEPLRPVASFLQRGRLMHIRGQLAHEEGSDKSSANAMYGNARLSNTELKGLEVNERQRAMLEHTQQDASFWLGVVALERGRHEAAIEHLKKRTLEDSPDGPWTTGARYNLARCYEALGRTQEAIDLYEADTSSQRHGNLLRAKRLKEQMVKE